MHEHSVLWTSQAGGDLGTRVLMPVCIMSLEVRAEDIRIEIMGISGHGRPAASSYEDEKKKQQNYHRN